MTVETRKVFKVTSKDIGISVMIAVVVMLIVYHVLGLMFVGTARISVMMILILLYLLTFVPYWMERVIITPHAVIQVKLFDRKLIPMDLILNVERGMGSSVGFETLLHGSFNFLLSLFLGTATGGGSSALLFRTREELIELSGLLVEGQLGEIQEYVMENMKTYYPENYDAMKMAEAQREREEVKKFWSQ
ncbi:hypothetical protein HYN46_14240 [Aquirhabdus parva]|uniref:Uncharacterized protein n=2 Tax=Aquirhabdus parva TaxID=2283318 RepID=A0A345P9D7_9GAMM|nr:hypothetical protein HYN46_14240 [Aquirhabdus parva]